MKNKELLNLNTLEEQIQRLSNLDILTGAIIVTKINDLEQEYKQAFVFLPLIKKGDTATQVEIVSCIRQERKKIVLVECDCCITTEELLLGRKGMTDVWRVKTSEFLLTLFSGRPWLENVWLPGQKIEENWNGEWHYASHAIRMRMSMSFGFPILKLSQDQLYALMHRYAPNLVNYFPYEREFIKEFI